jgi:hypothetical protein
LGVCIESFRNVVLFEALYCITDAPRCIYDIIVGAPLSYADFLQYVSLLNLDSLTLQFFYGMIPARIVPSLLCRLNGKECITQLEPPPVHLVCK